MPDADEGYAGFVCLIELLTTDVMKVSTGSPSMKTYRLPNSLREDI